jgi:hypothetical protein
MRDPDPDTASARFERLPSQEVRPFPSAHEDKEHTHLDPMTPQTQSPAYKLGFADPDFLLRDELRSARLQLEFLKADLLQRDRGIVATVVMFGSARIPSPEQIEARHAAPMSPHTSIKAASRTGPMPGTRLKAIQ